MVALDAAMGQLKLHKPLLGRVSLLVALSLTGMLSISVALGLGLWVVHVGRKNLV